MLTSWLLSIVIAQTLMLVAWLIYRYIGNPIVADIAWGINISLIAFMHQGQHLYLHWSLVLVSLWGLRLSLYLYITRLRHHWHDKRYQALEARSPHLFLNYQTQGVLQTIIALPWLFIASPTPLVLEILAVFLFVSGLTIETIADYQLQHFKSTSTGVCQYGLWQYSRHPNYFGEILIWLSFATLGLSHHWGWIGFGSPLGLYAIMRFITGPLTESTSITSKGQAYREYQKITPMIFPKLRFCFQFKRS